jgi:hypothetical protein
VALLWAWRLEQQRWTVPVLAQTMVAAPAQEWPEGRIMLDVEVRVWLSMRAEMLLKVRVNDRLQGRRAGRLRL